MATVIHLSELEAGTDEPPDPAFVADLYAGRAHFAWCWQELLAMAVRDGAVSVHYHPWRTNAVRDDTLAYIAGGARYGLVPPTEEAGAELLASARRLAAPGLFGRLWTWAAGGAVGRIRAVTASSESEWCVVCWGRGRLAGVDFLRLSPVPAAAAVSEQVSEVST